MSLVPSAWNIVLRTSYAVLRTACLAVGAILVLAIVLPAAPLAAAEAPAAKPQSAGLPWLSNLAEAQRRAAADRKPVLVRVGADWCPTCRKLAAQIETPEVQRELARWTLVYLDATASVEDAARLNVVAVPALRARTPSGRTVASHNGGIEAAALAAWLAKHYDAAADRPDASLLESGPPDAEALMRLLKQLDQREAALREAAIRRLAAHPDRAKAPVVKAFAEGNLATRLAAVEVLRQWQAPLADLDPWQPDTFTQERLSALKAWGEKAETAQPAEAAKLTPQQRAEAGEQIDRMLKAADSQAEAIRERLARLGQALLPEVYERLAKAATDRDRERLLALRYRLAAGDSLVLRWPGGLVRLAATDTRQRQRAAEELAGRAIPEDGRLLLELFSDPDPLVREIALRGLQQVGGGRASESLVKLLDDPEPNVRAAVLKQLAEGPSPALAAKVAKYIEGEKDADLVVHAIRVLKEAGGAEAVKALVARLAHPSWQVRAEAAEALGKSRDIERLPLGAGEAAGNLQVEVYVALIKLLDDADAFVVSRAVAALQGADMDVAVEPLVKAAEKHPDLAPKIIGILARAQRMKLKALPHLRGFTRHKDPALRAAALEGLVQAAGGAMDDELVAALADPESQVRTAAAAAVFQLMQTHRSKARESAARLTTRAHEVEVSLGMSDEPRPTLSSRVVGALLGGLGVKKPPVEKPAEKPAEKPVAKPEAVPEEKPTEAEPFWDTWLAGCYAGANRPKWTERMIEPLEKLLSAADPGERTEVALALVPLGRADKALPVLLATAEGKPDLVRRAGEVLPWLLWDKRLATFHELRKRAAGGAQETAASLIGNMAEADDARAADVFWQLLADPKVSENEADALETGLRRAYLGERYWSASEALPSQRRAMAKAARGRATSGSELERLAALVLLAGADRGQAAEVSAQLLADSKLSPELRRDAFQALLVTESKAAASKAAIDALANPDPAWRKLALGHLAQGPERYNHLRGRFRLDVAEGPTVSSSRDGLPIIPEAPPGLKPEHVRPLAKDSAPEVAALAGYLLAVLHEPEGLGPLLRFWHDQKGDKQDLDRLVYRAIAALDDSSQMAALREIHGRLDEYEMRDFYWTIRIMSGPEILKLRKEIRDAVGMDRLR